MMLDKINNLAEKLATNVGQSRRGFLVKAGQAALGVVGVLLALPDSQAQAAKTLCFCTVISGGGGRIREFVHNGFCLDLRTCRAVYNQGCVGGPVGRVKLSRCASLMFDAAKPCSQ
jgi:hypothetical protein